MKLSLLIAKRYLFSRKSHQVINIISGVAIAGIALATAAMICTLSVFNGFTGIVAEQFTVFDPDIRITAAKGKSFTTDSEKIKAVGGMPEIETVSFCVEDKAMIEYDGKQVMVTLKGVDSNFPKLTNIERALAGSGQFILEDSLDCYALFGAGVANAFNCALNTDIPFEVYAPNRGGKLNLTMPARNFKKGKFYSNGLVFIVNQPKYDANYVITSDKFARKIFRRDENEATSMELKLTEGADMSGTKEKIEKILGDGFNVKDRYEQQEDIFKVMQIEKLISYIFLSFILLVACFNIVSSLSMLIIEKRDNMNTLRSMGADRKTIANIFVYEGVIISAIGAISGILLGVGVCMAQQQFGIIPMGGNGGFIVDSYPVEIHAADVLTTFITVLVTGILAVWLPVKLLTRKFV